MKWRKRIEKNDMVYYKLTAKMLKDPATLLRSVHAVTNDNAYPQHVYVCKQDYNKIVSNLRKLLKKQSPYASKRVIETTIGFEMLNLGPNTSNGVKPGYVIVDANGIEKDIKDFK